MSPPSNNDQLTTFPHILALVISPSPSLTACKLSPVCGQFPPLQSSWPERARLYPVSGCRRRSHPGLYADNTRRGVDEQRPARGGGAAGVVHVTGVDPGVVLGDRADLEGVVGVEPESARQVRRHTEELTNCRENCVLCRWYDSEDTDKLTNKLLSVPI